MKTQRRRVASTVAALLAALLPTGCGTCGLFGTYGLAHICAEEPETSQNLTCESLLNPDAAAYPVSGDYDQEGSNQNAQAGGGYPD